MKKYSTMSLVWKYFKVRELDVSKVVCLLCFPGGDDELNPNVKYLSRGPKMKSFSTKPMWNHLRSMHPLEHDVAMAQQQQNIASSGGVRKSNPQYNASMLNPKLSFGTPRPNFGPGSLFGSHDFGSSPSWSTTLFMAPNFFESAANSKLRDDRKVEVGGFTGLSESSAGSGDNPGGCDEVSIPLSPEQFMSEETEHGSALPRTRTPTPQRPESYKLRHNNHLNLVLESLAGDESFMDVTLTAQGKAIKAHKSVLSAVSPYFRSVLKENPCQHPIIIMPRDIRFEELNSIISYIYKGEMTVAAEELSSLLKTAEILQVTGLSPSDAGGGSGGIMSQMQGIPAGFMPNASKKLSKQKQNAHQMLQQHHQQLNQQQDDDEDDESMTDDANDPQGSVDPLEFLNADMTCVKEEIKSDNEDESQSTHFPVCPSGSNNVSDTVGASESSNSSPNRRKSASGSPKPVEDIVSKPFNPGEPCGSLSADETLYDSSNSVPFLCPHCVQVHRPLDSLHSHLRLKHPTKPAFVCTCGRVFSRGAHLTEHSKKCKF